MEYNNLDEFLDNPSFLNYCFNRNDSDVHYWERWLIAHPEQEDRIVEAKRLVLLMGAMSAKREGDDNYRQLLQQISINKQISIRKKIVRKIISYSAAALMLLTVVASFYFYQQHNQPKGSVPEGNRATLTLANGKQVPLNEKKERLVIDAQHFAYDDGTIVSMNDKKEDVKNSVQQWNTIATPNGGQYQLLLADGTKVWLNAASQLKFPASFSGESRKVELAGEAYFEVAEDKMHPFYVITPRQRLDVLGTAFNISAYTEDRAEITTLVNGAIKVSSEAEGENSSKILRPNEQAFLEAGKLAVKTVNAAKEISWINGFFSFNDEPLSSIMQKISRWYDLEIVYQGADPAMRFWGGMSRHAEVADVLKRLELTGNVHFKLKGRRVFVMQ